MRKDEIEVGGVYSVKVNGDVVPVKVLIIHMPAIGRTRYGVKNLKTGRETTFRSAAKFRNKCVSGKATADEAAKTKNQPATLKKEEWIGVHPDDKKELDRFESPVVQQLARVLADVLSKRTESYVSQVARLVTNIDARDAVKAALHDYCRSDLARYFV